jgi:hypothetical protein
MRKPTKKEIGNFLPLSRQFFNNPLWTERREFSKAEAWIYLIYNARYEATVTNSLIDGKLISWGRGELPASIRYLVQAWQWSKGKVERYLSFLENEGMITRRLCSGITVISLNKYEVFNGSKPHGDAASENDPKNGTPNGTPTGTANAATGDDFSESAGQQGGQQRGNGRDTDGDKTERKRIKKKEFIAPTLQDVKEYFKDNGYKEETAIKAFEYYSTNEWRDKNNDPVLNWKQKMVGNWFKSEHKIQETKKDDSWKNLY